MHSPHDVSFQDCTGDDAFGQFLMQSTPLLVDSVIAVTTVNYNYYLIPPPYPVCVLAWLKAILILTDCANLQTTFLELLHRNSLLALTSSLVALKLFSFYTRVGQFMYSTAS